MHFEENKAVKMGINFDTDLFNNNKSTIFTLRK